MTRRYDRTGEPIEDDVDDPTPDTPTPHDPGCRGGWLGEDKDGRLVPCLVCRPHLADRRDHVRRVLYGTHR